MSRTLGNIRRSSQSKWLISAVLLAQIVALATSAHIADATDAITVLDDKTLSTISRWNQSCSLIASNDPQQPLECFEVAHEQCDPVTFICGCIDNYVYDPVIKVCTFNLYSWSTFGQMLFYASFGLSIALMFGLMYRYAIRMWLQWYHRRHASSIPRTVLVNDVDDEELADGYTPTPGLSLYEAKQEQFEYFRRLRERDQRRAESEQAARVAEATN